MFQCWPNGKDSGAILRQRWGSYVSERDGRKDCSNLIPVTFARIIYTTSDTRFLIARRSGDTLLLLGGLSRDEECPFRPFNMISISSAPERLIMSPYTCEKKCRPNTKVFKVEEKGNLFYIGAPI